MKTPPSELYSKAIPTTRVGKIIQFPLCRIVIAIGFLIPVFLLNKGLSEGINPLLSENSLILARYIEAAVSFALLLWAFILYTKYIEKRKTREILVKGWLGEIGTGFLVSLILVCIVVCVLYFSKYFNVSSIISNKRFVLDLFVKFFMGAFIEELIFRLIIYKLTEELLGTWIALLIQVLLFGFAHGLNENATLFTTFSVVIVGGLVYCAAYIYTRSLWLPLGFHFGWNFSQSGIFSMPNSGTPYEGLLLSNISGPEWLTGGNWGIEGSYIAIFLCLAIGIAIMSLAKRKAYIVLPIWKRR
jgi:membrane protease YdiL (CAAX protease family)